MVGNENTRAADPRKEEGQATVETVIALLLGCLILFGVLALIMGAYSLNVAFGGIQAASWEVNASEMQLSGDKNAYVKNVITSRVTGIDRDSLEITNARIDSSSTTNSFAVETRTNLGESTLTRRADSARIRFTVTYTAPCTFGLFKVSRDVDHSISTAVRAEVS